MKVSMAGCSVEFVSGVKSMGDGVFQMDGTPVQLKLIRHTKAGTHWLDGSSLPPSLRIKWMERADDSQASDDKYVRGIRTADNGEWSFESDIVATSELNTLLFSCLKDRYFVGYFILEAEFIFAYGDANISAPVSVLLVAPEKKN